MFISQKDLLILVGLVFFLIILVLLFRKDEKYTYNAYEAEQRDRMDDESIKFLRYYRRMDKELKQKI
jgi:hypothetical protein